jgi:Tol biopolymer transport system component
VAHAALRHIGLAALVSIAGTVPTPLRAADAAVQLTFDGKSTKAAWSPDGARIAHMSTRGPSGLWDLWAVPALGGTPIRLTVSPPQLSWPTYSPGGDRIACASAFYPGYLWVIPSGGGAATQLTSGGTDYQPAWSPDGMRIAFSSFSNGRTSIWVVDADGGPATQLTFGPWRGETCPAWSPDGTQIAFVALRDVGLGGGIAVAPATGGPAVLITDSPTATSDLSPSWSPDGSRIVFTRYSSGTWEDLWIVPATGGAPAQLTNGAGTRDTLPAWSPDGTSIAFTSDRSGAVELWRLPFGPISVRTESWGAIKGKYRK